MLSFRNHAVQTVASVQDQMSGIKLSLRPGKIIGVYISYFIARNVFLVLFYLMCVVFAKWRSNELYVHVSRLNQDGEATLSVVLSRECTSFSRKSVLVFPDLN